MGDSIGGFNFFQFKEHDSQVDITPLAKQLGLGPMVFLLRVKAMTYFFFFIMLLHIPLYGIYYNGGN